MWMNGQLHVSLPKADTHVATEQGSGWILQPVDMERKIRVFACNSTAVAYWHVIKIKNKKKLLGLSVRANYTDQATAACRWS
jgi:hypothetical protein